MKMELKRTCLMLLFVWGDLWTAGTLCGSDNGTGLGLDCLNDMESMSCHLQSQAGEQRCAGYTLTFPYGSGEKRCVFQRCDRKCCCRVQMTLVMNEIHVGTVWKGNECVESKDINVTASLKPKRPTIVSVSESNGNFPILWKTNMEDHIFDLPANVTYHKKGDTETVSQSVKPSIVNGLKYYEILGQHLEPSTTYLVSVRSYTSLSGRFSDSSPEGEFTTPDSPHFLHLAIIFSLSIVAFILTGAAFSCYEKFKAECWDKVAKCPNPKLLDMHPGEQKLLKPLQTCCSSVSIDPAVLHNTKPRSKVSLTDTGSGISAGPSSASSANTEPVDIKAGVQDALAEVFIQLGPKTSTTTNLLTESNKDSGLLFTPDNPHGVKADDSNFSPESTDFDNKTYLPNWPHQIATQAEMLCVSAYHPSEGDIVISPDQQAPARPLVNSPPLGSSLMPTDMSYQQQNADSGKFPYTEDSSLSI